MKSECVGLIVRTVIVSNISNLGDHNPPTLGYTRTDS